MAYDFGSSQQGSGSNLPAGFPPMGGDAFGSPEFGLPSRFSAKEEPDEKPTDEAAVVLMVKGDLKPWEESGRISPELSVEIEKQMLDFFRSEMKEPDVGRITEMIRQIEASNKALADDVKASARQILEKFGKENISPELINSNTFYQTELAQESAETTVEDSVPTRTTQKPVDQDSQQIPKTQSVPKKPAEIIPAPVQAIENGQDTKVPVAQSKPTQKPKDNNQSGIIHLPLPNDSDEIQNIDLAA